MNICYAVCEVDIQINNDLKAKIKRDLMQAIHKDNISVIINGFGNNADVLNSIINSIDSFTGGVREERLCMWESYKFDVIFIVDSSYGSEQWLRAAIRTRKQIRVVLI